MPIELAIAPASPAYLDRLDADTLLLPLYEITAQPLGAAGYVDWRLCGRLGRMIRERRFSGARGEALLLSYRPRVPVARIVVLGLGASASPSEDDAHADLARMIAIAEAAGARSVALGAPEPPPARLLPADRAPGPAAAELLELWLSAPVLGSSRLDRVILLDPDGSLRKARSRLMAAAASSVVWAGAPA